jgi:ribosome maturation factor RimP
MIENKIKTLINNYLEGTEKFLVELKLTPSNKIIVEIDSDNIVLIEDCVKLSRFIESNFDRDVEDYELQVSSAGLENPLKLKRQYFKNIGRNAEILLNDGSRKSGVLKSVDEDGIELQEDLWTVNKKGKKIKKNQTAKSLIKLLFTDINETKILVSFKK